MELTKCHCFECASELSDFNTAALTKIYLCPQCGNKRCPHATDHRLVCTNNNESGQLGSRYGVYPHPNINLIRFANGENPKSI